MGCISESNCSMRKSESPRTGVSVVVKKVRLLLS